MAETATILCAGCGVVQDVPLSVASERSEMGPTDERREAEQFRQGGPSQLMRCDFNTLPRTTKPNHPKPLSFTGASPHGDSGLRSVLFWAKLCVVSLFFLFCFRLFLLFFLFVLLFVFSTFFGSCLYV